MATKLVYLGVVILTLIAIFLGYKIYQQQVSLEQTASTTQNASIQKIQNNNSPKPEVQQTQDKITQPQESSIEEANLVKTAPLNATVEERIEYSKKLNQFAKDATTIEITDCRPYPLIVRVQENTAPYIVNNDYIEHALRLGETDLKVPAKGTISVKIGKIEQYTNFDCISGSSGMWLPQ